MKEIGHPVHQKCVFWTHNSDILAKALLSHLDWCGTIVNTCMSHPKHYTKFSVTSETDCLQSQCHIEFTQKILETCFLLRNAHSKTVFTFHLLS